MCVARDQGHRRRFASQALGPRVGLVVSEWPHVPMWAGADGIVEV